MKRVIACLLAVLLVMSLSTAVFAAPSKGSIVEVIKSVDPQGEPIPVELNVTSIPWITEKVASQVPGTNADESELKVLWQRDITAHGKAVTITFRVTGMAGEQLFVYHHNGTEWELVHKGVGEDITVSFDSLSPVAIVLYRPGGFGGNETESPATGVGMAFYAACGVFLMAGASAAVVARKKEI